MLRKPVRGREIQRESAVRASKRDDCTCAGARLRRRHRARLITRDTVVTQPILAVRTSKNSWETHRRAPTRSRGTCLRGKQGTQDRRSMFAFLRCRGVHRRYAVAFMQRSIVPSSAAHGRAAERLIGHVCPVDSRRIGFSGVGSIVEGGCSRLNVQPGIIILRTF